MKNAAAVGCAIWLLLILTACGLRDHTAGELRIGVIAPLTGELPGIGDSTIKAAELAVDPINEAGLWHYGDIFRQ